MFDSFLDSKCDLDEIQKEVVMFIFTTPYFCRRMDDYEGWTVTPNEVYKFFNDLVSLAGDSLVDSEEKFNALCKDLDENSDL